MAGVFGFSPVLVGIKINLICAAQVYSLGSTHRRMKISPEESKDRSKVCSWAGWMPSQAWVGGNVAEQR